MENSKYKEIQYFKPIIALILIFSLGFILLYLTQYGNKPMTISGIITCLTLFLVIFILFYKLKIEIDNEYLKISFGIGIIRKSILLKEIDQNRIIKKEIKWFHGMGIRFTPYGTLYNASASTAVGFKIKNTGKGYLIVTKKPEQFLGQLSKFTAN